MFAAVGEVLQSRGLKPGTGKIVDATLIGAPSSTKNADKARDPEMHRTRKGPPWYFGMMLHGAEQRVDGDSAYASRKALIESKAPQARDFTHRRVPRAVQIDEVRRAKSRDESRVRARVEHVFAVVQCLCCPGQRAPRWWATAWQAGRGAASPTQV